MKNHFEISVLKEGEELPKDCIVEDVEDVEGAAGVKVMKGISEEDEPVTAAYLFDKRKWSEAEADIWIEEKNKINKLEPVKKSLAPEFKNFNDDTLTFDAIASTDAVDRDGDILRASGWQLKDFKKNPVLLWGHDSRSLPVGKVLNVKKEDGKLTFTAQMEGITMRGEMIYSMFKEGYLNAFSVRFDPKEWKDREPPKEGGKNGERFGREYTKLELLEISVVTIPANAEALISRDFQNFVVKNMQMQNIDLVNDPILRDEIMKGKIKDGEETPAPTEKKPEEKKEEEKSGRVLSAKNRKLVNAAMEAIGTTNGALQALLEAAEPQAGVDTDDELIKLKEDLDKIGDEENVERIIQDGNNVLREIEEGGK